MITNTPYRRIIGWILLLGWLLPALAVHASGEEGQARAAPDAQPVPEALRSPRTVMASFLHAMNDIKRGKPERIDAALETLDLSQVNPLVRQERGTDLAWMLLEAFDRTRLVDLEEVPDHAQGAPWVFETYRSGALRILRQPDGSWLFDSRSVAQLPDIIRELQDSKRVTGAESEQHLPLHLRIRQRLPDSLTQRAFLLDNWLWLALLIIIGAGVLVDKLVSLLLRALVHHWRVRTRTRAFADLPYNMLRPFGLMAMAMLWWIGINLIGLPEQALLVLLVAVKFLASAAGVWAAYRLVDLIGARLHEHAESTENKLDDVLVPLIPRTLKIFITVIGAIFVADNLNIDVTGLVAGLGLGGLAFALASKDMVQNLFGSITILLDRTFTVGDWIKVDDIDGSVEQIGFRSTRIRTFYNSLITLPNSRFITSEVDNMGKRRYRRLSTSFGLAYDTPPERIEAFCEGVRELVRQHPYMRRDYYHVYLNALGASSLDVLVYVFWETPDWSTELRERHRFLLDCLRLAQQLEIEYAFPTQTLYLRQEQTGEPAQTPELNAAQDLGRETAAAIVEATTGKGVKPPPVRFN